MTIYADPRYNSLKRDKIYNLNGFYYISQRSTMTYKNSE